MNRREISDPVLLGLLGDVRGLVIADIGCGNGYLSRNLAKNGAHVIAVEPFEKMQLAFASFRTCFA